MRWQTPDPLVLLVFVDPVLVPPAQPYGAQIICETLANRGIRASTIWPNLAPNPIAALTREFQQLRPAIVGFSFRNLDSASVNHEQHGSFADLLVDYVATLRRHAITAVGGSGYSIDPIRLLRDTGAHIGFIGPAAYEFAEFCDRILQGSTVHLAAAGLETAVLPDAKYPPRLRPQRLGGAGAFHDTAFRWAHLVGGTVPVRTKTGCSLRCSYCVVPSIEAVAYRQCSEIERELAMIAAAGCGDRIFIADGEFNLPSPKRATEIARHIQRRFGKMLRWRCYLEAGFITDELPPALAEAGCTAVSLTVDSLSNDVRRALGKQTEAATAIRGVEQCLASGLTTNVNILAGAPGETTDSLQETATQLQHLLRGGASVFIAVGLRVYPGTPLAQTAAKPSHDAFVQRDATDHALASYCAPFAPEAVRGFMNNLLPPSAKVVYLPVDRDDSFYQQLATAASHLTETPNAAAEQFHALAVETGRPEAMLGHLYAERQRRRTLDTETACP